LGDLLALVAENAGVAAEFGQALAIGGIQAFDAVAPFEELVEVGAFEEDGPALEAGLALEKLETIAGGLLAAVVGGFGVVDLSFEAVEIGGGEDEAFLVVLEDLVGFFEVGLKVGEVTLGVLFALVDTFFLLVNALLILLDLGLLLLELIDADVASGRSVSGRSVSGRSVSGRSVSGRSASERSTSGSGCGKDLGESWVDG
jgi:hypothetical protein